MDSSGGGVDTRALVSAIRELDTSFQKSIAMLDGSAGKNSLPDPKSLPPLKSKEPKRAEKVQVYVRVVFLKLGEINTVQEKFSADAFIQSHWLEPTLDGAAKDCDVDLPHNHPYWTPKLFIENAHGDLKESVWYQARYDDQGKASLVEKRRVKGTFFEKMELMEYPFDTQDLTITVSTEMGEEEVGLEADKLEVSSVNVESFVDEQEWYLHKHINTWTKITTNAYQNTKHKHPALSVSCKATRRFQFFFWNVILVMVFICSLVFSTFAVEHSLIQNRLQLSFILLLSNITFKFTVSQTIPKVSYLTYLDKYILSSMAILCVVCAWHAIVGSFWQNDKDTAELADNIALGILAVIFILFNSIFLIWSRMLIYRKQRKYALKDKEQQEQVLKLEDKKLGKKVAPLASMDSVHVG